MFVKPGPNEAGPGGAHVVRIPRTHEALPAEGREVPEDQFWMRRVRDGDVVLADAPASEQSAALETIAEPHEAHA